MSSQIASLLKVLPNLEEIENRVKEVIEDSKPLTEEEQLKQFIKDYIDEPVPKFSWKDAFQKQLAYSTMYGGRGMGKSFAYHNLTVMDDPPIVHEKVTLKPTKKQAKLLKKFRKLKRFKC